MKNIFLFALILSGIFAFSYASAIPNPASGFCENMGYTLSGEDCVFPDGTKCEQWSFYNKECGANFVKDLPCRKNGQSLTPGTECCSGLVGVENSAPVSSGGCGTVVGNWNTCRPCGNGTCDEGENTCNCPKDCKNLQAQCSDICPSPSAPFCPSPGKLISAGNDNCGCNLGATCCGNSKCEGKETKGNCPEDCKAFDNKNGKVKIMPETASQNAIQKLGDLGFNIQLKEVGQDDNAKYAYEAQGEKEVKIFGFFKVKMKIRAEVNAENGEVSKVQKPWWSFLAW